MSVKLKKIGDSAVGRIEVKTDTDLLEKLEKELSKKMTVQIGVLGVKAKGRVALAKMDIGAKKKATVVTGDSTLSNADIGLIHEKGSKSRGIPRRSFIEYPVVNKMPPIMAKIAKYLTQELETSGLRAVYITLGKAAERVVLQAFSSRGYGTWEENSPSTIQRKGSDMPLIDSAQLRNSIAFRVVNK